MIDDFDNGIDALQSINSQQPDIAILDIEIPGMTGLEVLSQLRNKINTKVIIVTTFKRPGYFERAVANDVDAYVLKERSVDDLVATIHKSFKWRKKNIVRL